MINLGSRNTPPFPHGLVANLDPHDCFIFTAFFFLCPLVHWHEGTGSHMSAAAFILVETLLCSLTEVFTPRN